MTIEQGIQMFSGFCYGISATLIMQMISRRLSNKDKQRRRQAIDMIDLQTTVDLLDHRVNACITTSAETFRKQQHHLDNLMRQTGKGGSMQQRFKKIEERQDIEGNEIRIFRSNIVSLRERTKNLETYIKQFSAEDLKRMQADEYVLNDLTKEVEGLKRVLVFLFPDVVKDKMQ